MANLNSTSSIKGNGERETLSPKLQLRRLDLVVVGKNRREKESFRRRAKKSVSLQLLPKRDKLDEKVNLSTTAAGEMDPFSLLISSGLVTPGVDIL